MRERLEICSKIVFRPLLVTFGTEGGDLAKKGAKEGVLLCSAFTLVKWKFFHTQSCFSSGPSQKSVTLTRLRIIVPNTL